MAPKRTPLFKIVSVTGSPDVLTKNQVFSGESFAEAAMDALAFVMQYTPDVRLDVIIQKRESKREKRFVLYADRTKAYVQLVPIGKILSSRNADS